MKKLILITLFLSTGLVYSQSKENKEKAVEIAMNAIKIMDEGNYDEAIELLKKSIELDPKRIDFPYEIGYAQYVKKDYNAAIKTLTKLIKHKNVNDRVYQLLGNCYDDTDKPEKALSIYKKGLKKFPKSGKLYTEQGILEYNREKYDDAIKYWEKGIEAEPTYSSNYYWLGKTFSYSDERIWSVLYSESFINLERNSKRTIEISELLFKTYKESISITSDSTGGVHFSKVNTIEFNKNKLLIPFPITFGLTMTASLGFEMLSKEPEISINSINSIRQEFIHQWYTQKRNKEYPNIIFDFQKELKDKGYFESYNYWLLMKGDEIEFNKWLLKNETKFNEFINWYTDNPIEFNKKEYFSRNNY